MLKGSTVILVLAVAAAQITACVRNKPITNDDVRALAVPGTHRADVERDLRAAGAAFLCKPKTQLDAEPRSPQLEWQSPASVEMCIGNIHDVRTLYYMLSSEHIAFEIEIGPTGEVTAARIYNAYTGP